uniref:receptor like protein kinase S.2-like n=1 Tax=Erigeron canadensis TaxID=72917 RepID=UPI001CB8E96E|nr:receptor like protein kinase S.2-like [Erigeron canadensis]
MSITMFLAGGHKAESSKSSRLGRQLTFSEIQLATQNFDESLVIGRGGFGKVYRGTITHGGSLLEIAIKRLESTSNQGALEFWAEVEMLSKLRHCHLVSLIGYCDDGQEMILVYEYMPHGTFEDHLHKRLSSLPWIRRLKISIGAARGLDYLHTGTGIKHGVIHRDVKSSNILLDYNWEAKISDFGLSKISPINQPSTYVNTLVKGTFGYLDPVYFQTGKLTRKSDVYAFGVVLFEVLCGKRAVDRSLDEDQWGLASWAQDSIKQGRLKQIIDFNMRGIISPKCLKEFSRLAERCVHSHPKHRPTMAEVVVSLKSILALQMKVNSALQPVGLTVFAKKVSMSVFPSNVENSVSLKSLELYLDTIQGDNQIFRRFDFDTISVATDTFSKANTVLLNRYDTMYKGRLQNGQAIAIAETSLSTPSYIKYYMREVSILINFEHENLVKLLGYCIEGTKMFLVYEFTPHASLDRLIFDPMCTLLDWNIRFKIILGVARVLVYLHKHAPVRIIHGDVKPEKILLNESMAPKLSGFGLASPINKTDCMLDNAVHGTLGCIAPGYRRTSHLSTKDDVFSFGVSLLETISGRSTLNQLSKTKHLYEYVWRNWLEGTPMNVVDPRINMDSSLMSTFIEIGLLCVQANAVDRPTMEEVVGMLHSNSSLTLPVAQMRSRMIRKRSECTNSQVDDYDTGEVEESLSDLYPR